MREFDAYTGDLYRLADWLAECEVATVVMESTGMYWIPLFGVLEERGFEAMLVDPGASRTCLAARPTSMPYHHLLNILGVESVCEMYLIPNPPKI